MKAYSKHTVMNKKDSQGLKILTVLALLGCLSLMVFLTVTRATVLHRTDSPHQRYRVEIVQRRLVGERAVYLDAYRDGKPIVRRKLLYTGDFLDDAFMDLYPSYSWAGESALRIGTEVREEPQSAVLMVSNESPSCLNYLLIESGWNKIALFDVDPGSSLILHFPVSGGFTSQGELAETKKRLGVGASAPTNGEAGPFEIVVRSDTMIVKYRNRVLEKEHCCASDRPDFDHELLY